MRLSSVPDFARDQDSFQDLLCLGPHQKQVALELPNCPAGEGAVGRRPMRQPRKGVLALTGNDAAAGRWLYFRRDGPAPKAGASTWKDPNCGRRLGNSRPHGAIAAGQHGSWPRRDNGCGATLSEIGDVARAQLWKWPRLPLFRSNAQRGVKNRPPCSPYPIRDFRGSKQSMASLRATQVPSPRGIIADRGSLPRYFSRLRPAVVATADRSPTDDGVRNERSAIP